MKPPSMDDTKVKAMAYLTDEGFGYERWRADQCSGGRGNRPAIISFFNSVEERDAAFESLATYKAKT